MATPLSTFQLLRCTLTSISIHVFTTPSLSISRCSQAPECCNGSQCAGQRSAGYSRRRKRGIFYSRTLTWKGTFIFADRRVSLLFLPSSKLSRGNINATVREHSSRVQDSKRFTIRISFISSKNLFHPTLAHRNPSFFQFSVFLF